MLDDGKVNHSGSHVFEALGMRCFQQGLSQGGRRLGTATVQNNRRGAAPETQAAGSIFAHGQDFLTHNSAVLLPKAEAWLLMCPNSRANSTSHALISEPTHAAEKLPGDFKNLSFQRCKAGTLAAALAAGASGVKLRIKDYAGCSWLLCG